MLTDNYVSTAYLRLVLAGYPKLEPLLEQLIGSDYQTKLNQEYVDGELFEHLFPLLQKQGVDSLLLSFGRQFHLASHGPLGVAALAAPDLKTSLSTLVQFTPIRSSVYTSTLVTSETSISLSMSAHSGSMLVRQWLVEIAIDLARAIIETTMGHEIGNQVKISFRQPPPPYQEALARFIGTPCEFNCEADSITIPVSWGDVRSPLADPASHQDALVKCRDILFKLTHEKNSVSSVKHLLEQHFEQISPVQAKSSQPSNVAANEQPNRRYDNTSARLYAPPPSLTEIAHQMHLTPRTLTRKLKARNSGYKEILTDIRRAKAQAWLRTTHLSVSEIAYLLGYQEPANFTRAFRSWNNCSPSAWRKLQ